MTRRPDQERAAGRARRAARAGTRAVKGFWSGFTYPFRGARFVYLGNPGLVRYWIWPILITLVVFAGVILAVILWSDDLLGLVWAEPSGAGFWVGVQKVLRPVVHALVILVLLVAGILAVWVLTSLFSAPFKDLLSEEVERLSRGKEPPPFSWKRLARDLWLTIRLELGKTGAYLAVMIPAFVLSFVLPVAGQIIYTIFGYFFTIAFFAIDYTDWPLARRGRGVRERLALLRAHSMRMMGLGTAVWLMLIVPFANLLFMPAAVAGGTLLILDIEDEGGL